MVASSLPSIWEFHWLSEALKTSVRAVSVSVCQAGEVKGAKRMTVLDEEGVKVKRR